MAGDDFGRNASGKRHVSPMFSMLGVVSADSEESVELRALRNAMERMQLLEPQAWEAVVRSFKPWALGPPPVTAEHLERLHGAALMLAGMVDNEVGE